MKFIKNNWLLIILIITIILYFNLKPFGINDLQSKIDLIEIEKDDLKKGIAKNEEKIKKIRMNKELILKDYNKLLSDSQIKPPSTVKTIYIDKVKYVEKIVYKELWTFSLSLRNEFDEYIKKDIKEQAETDKIISDLKLVNIKSEKIITYKDKQLSQWEVRWGAGVFFNGKFSLGVGLMFSKRIKIPKIFKKIR